MTENDSIIRMRKVRKAFGGQIVLDDVDLDVRRGKTTVVIGPSGCGKTVLLKHMIALLRPDKGDVWYREHHVSRMSERSLAKIRSRFGFVFQGGALFDSMTVEENICFPLEEHAMGSQEDRRNRCRSVLSMVGLDGLQDRYPENLSGGQKKRVALARAIVLDPEVILYDEPTTGLDPIRADLISELILKMQSELHATSVVVTHDMESARKVGDRIVMLYNGNLIVDTTPGELAKIDHEVVQRFVEGRASPDELDALDHGNNLESFVEPTGKESETD